MEKQEIDELAGIKQIVDSLKDRESEEQFERRKAHFNENNEVKISDKGEIKIRKKSDRQKAMNYIKVYLGAIRVGEVFYGSVLADYVKERLRKPNMYPATVLRYLRTMRSDGDVRFEVKNKKESKYVKL